MHPRCASKDSNLHSVALEATASAVGLDALIVCFQRRYSRHTSPVVRATRVHAPVASRSDDFERDQDPRNDESRRGARPGRLFTGKTRENRLGDALHRGQTAALPVGMGARIQWNELRHTRAVIIVGTSLSSTENEERMRNPSLRSGFETTCASEMSPGETTHIASARNHFGPHVARRLLSAQS